MQRIDKRVHFSRRHAYIQPLYETTTARPTALHFLFQREKTKKSCQYIYICLPSSDTSSSLRARTMRWASSLRMLTGSVPRVFSRKSRYRRRVKEGRWHAAATRDRKKGVSFYHTVVVVLHVSHLSPATRGVAPISQERTTRVAYKIGQNLPPDLCQHRAFVAVAAVAVAVAAADSACCSKIDPHPHDKQNKKNAAP